MHLFNPLHFKRNFCYNYLFLSFHLRFLNIELFCSHLFDGGLCSFPHLGGRPCFELFCLISADSFEYSKISFQHSFYFYFWLTYYLLIMACKIVFLSSTNGGCVRCIRQVKCIKRITFKVLYFINFSMPVSCLY